MWTNWNGEPISPTLTSRNAGGGQRMPDKDNFNAVTDDYIVRRLTPTECARLQGMPDWWCEDLATDDPTEEDISFWRKVFETLRRVVNPNGKAKTDAQLAKWAKHPYSEAAEYKMWGNGMALPCILYVFEGIAAVYGGTNE